MPLFTFEKWYFDGQTSDGSFFFLYLAPMTLLGKASAELVVSLFPAGGGAHRRSINLTGDQVQVEPGRTAAAFEGGELSLGPGRCHFLLRDERAQVTLRYEPLEPHWSPAGDDVVVRRRGGTMRWVVPVPRARLHGKVAVDGHEVEFDGYGYSDYVRTDIPPWSLPLRELLWGRALGPQTTVIWNRVGLKRGRAIDHACYGFIRTGDGDRATTRGLTADFRAWQDHGPTRDRFPTDLALDLSEPASRRVRLHPTTLNLGEFVADVQQFNSSFERGLYRAFTGNPVEYKLLSRVSLDGAPIDAWAAHEWIRWGRGRS